MIKTPSDIIIPEFVPFQEGEEKALILKAQKGDIQARNALVERHLRFISNKSKVFKHRRDTLEDALQNGVLGFIKAIEYWDESMDCKLITYAAFWIRASVRHRFNRTQLIHIPNHRLDTHDRVNDFPPSVYKDKNNKQHDRMQEVPAPKANIIHKMIIDEEMGFVKKALFSLNEKSRQIVDMYLQGMNKRKIAAKLGMTHQGIAYNLNSSFSEIRKAIQSYKTPNSPLHGIYKCQF